MQRVLFSSMQQSQEDEEDPDLSQISLGGENDGFREEASSLQWEREGNHEEKPRQRTVPIIC